MCVCRGACGHVGPNVYKSISVDRVPNGHWLQGQASVDWQRLWWTSHNLLQWRDKERHKRLHWTWWKIIYKNIKIIYHWRQLRLDRGKVLVNDVMSWGDWLHAPIKFGMPKGRGKTKQNLYRKQSVSDNLIHFLHTITVGCVCHCSHEASFCDCMSPPDRCTGLRLQKL